MGGDTPRPTSPLFASSFVGGDHMDGQLRQKMTQTVMVARHGQHRHRHAHHPRHGQHRHTATLIVDTRHMFSERKKKRPNRASPKTRELRTLIRSPTRRRFFPQCVDPESLLWKNWSSSSKSLNQLLFTRAAQDPMDEVYERFPGPLFHTTGTKVLKAMKWRVTKDRNNWLGRTPKRELFTGKISEYDWEGNYRELESAEKNSEFDTLTKSLSLSSTASSTISNVSDYNKEPNIKTHWHRMLSCRGCGVSIWYGKEEGPKGMSRCYPENVDWAIKVCVFM